MLRILCCLATVSALALAGEAARADGPARVVPLANGGFESNTVHEGWTVHVYGAEPKIKLDTGVCHVGKQSLGVSADQPWYTAFGLEVQLKPG
ncbi:MAG: hypothetical protein ACM359_06465, partial [Bacillota bacterium]